MGGHSQKKIEVRFEVVDCGDMTPEEVDEICRIFARLIYQNMMNKGTPPKEGNRDLEK
jgi:hypothetical protein